MSNKFKGTGNLGKTPELKYINTSEGQRAVTNFSVRFDRDKKTDDGSYVDNGGFWLDVAVFGHLAERIMKVIKKGNRVYVEGSLKQQTWEKEGVTYTRLVLEASYLALDLLGIEQIVYQDKNTSHQDTSSSMSSDNFEQDHSQFNEYNQEHTG